MSRSPRRPCHPSRSRANWGWGNSDSIDGGVFWSPTIPQRIYEGPRLTAAAILSNLDSSDLKRWLEAPAQLEDGTLVPRTRGTPQGGVVSPLTANIFLHLAFDDWMRRVHPGVPFERYADDIVAHCGTETQAKQVLDSIRRRLAQCRLEVHPGKTRIVYCKDDLRSRGYPQERFDFLGYTFRPRRSKNRWGKFFINFSPAVSADAMTTMRQE